MILKKMPWRFVARIFILKTSIIDDWLVAQLGYFQQWMRFNLFSTILFLAYINFTEIDGETVSWESSHKISQLVLSL